MHKQDISNSNKCSADITEYGDKYGPFRAEILSFMAEKYEPRNAVEADYKFFVENYDELYKKYGKCFLAIKDQKIIGIYDTEEAAKNDLADKYEPKTYSIKKCSGNFTDYMSFVFTPYCLMLSSHIDQNNMYIKPHRSE